MAKKKKEGARARKKRLKGYKERKARYVAEMDANPDHPLHGTRTGYTYGCKCVACAEAQRRWWREVGKVQRWDRWIKEGRVPKRNAARLAELMADPEHPDHGTVGAYWKGCRCDRCREAGREYYRVYRAKGRPRKESQIAKDAREVKEGLEAYKRWLAAGGTPEGWAELREITVVC